VVRLVKEVLVPVQVVVRSISTTTFCVCRATPSQPGTIGMLITLPGDRLGGAQPGSEEWITPSVDWAQPIPPQCTVYREGCCQAMLGVVCC